LDQSFADYVQKYGEDNARYIFEILHPPPKDNQLVFIEIPEMQHLGYAERCRAEAEAGGREFIQLQGSLRLFEKGLFGQWDEEAFLRVEPGQCVSAVYDWSEIIRVTT
jgi:hypothetical protein